MEIKNFYYKNKILEIDINKLFPDKFLNLNNYKEEEIISAATIIKKFGLMLPIMVRKNISVQGEYFVFNNLLSFLALKYLNVQKVPVLIFSYTLPEAVVFYLLQEKNLNIFKKAELFRFLLKKGNYTVKEICDIFKISPAKLDIFLLPLSLDKKERDIFISKSFSYSFLIEYLKLPFDIKENLLNSIIAENLSEKEGIYKIKELISPKEKPLKASCLKNDTVIMNSITKLSNNLKTFGISSTVKRKEMENSFEYCLIVDGNPNQLCFDFESIS
jgi:ParB family chromosome partitioning protein